MSLSSPFWGTRSSVPVFCEQSNTWISEILHRRARPQKDTRSHPTLLLPALVTHTHTHTHTLISLFSLEQSFEAKGRLYLAVRIRQGFWQPTFNFHLSFRVLTRFWRDKLSRILKKNFSKMTFIVTYADVSIFYCFSIPKVAYPGILNAFHI